MTALMVVFIYSVALVVLWLRPGEGLVGGEDKEVM